MEWKPIATAPLDGTRVLTYRTHFAESIAVAWYDADLGGWVPIHGFAGEWPDATHWLPLPEPPLTESKP